MTRLDERILSMSVQLVNEQPSLRKLSKSLCYSVLILSTALLLLTGCAQTHESASPRELFAKIAIGMTRSEVDKLLGQPVAPQLSPLGHAWYLPPPRIWPHESPFAPGTIGIRFTADGKVASKELNEQFRDE